MAMQSVAQMRASSDTPEPTSAPRASIVVLPFVNVSGDREQDYLVDGITESLITDLWRLPYAFVIARNTSFAYKGRALDVRQIGRELGVRYVLEGSVQETSDLVRVNAQLIDAETGAHLWAERFDRAKGALFEMQDAIVTRLARAMDTELIALEAKRSERAHLGDPDCVDLIFRGWAGFHRAHSPNDLAQAERYFGQALILSPRCAEALVGVALAKFARAATYTTSERTELLAEAEAAATNALRLEPDNSSGHGVLGWIYTETNRPLLGIAHSERGLQLDHNQASAHAAIGWAKTMLGRAEETEADIERAFRLSPKDSYAFVWCAIAGTAKLALGRTHEAVAWLSRGIELNRAFPIGHFTLASALAQQGRLDDARAAAAAGFALVPDFTVKRYREGAASDNVIYLALRERIYQGLRLAGIPEGDDLGEAHEATPPPISADALQSLSDFAAALKQALVDFTRPDLLERSPLLEAKLLQTRGTAGVAELQSLIAEAVETLFASPRDEKYRRVIELAYLGAALKQEAAAERLGFSLSTYRRHLSAARERLARRLWDREQELRQVAL
jgi:TolB-like protein/tetratricopeptide (TPR) repeat protein